MPLRPLFSAEGRADLAAVLRLRPLLAFDFDGTLAPIVECPDDARIAPALVALLQAAAARLPMAIVSGRARADLRRRIGFEPRFLVGNHGAEGLPGAPEAGADVALARLRQRLQRAHPELTAAGVTVEDKGGSLALHYRRAPDAAAAAATIERVLEPADPDWRVFGGKLVVNVAPVAAPDKAQAVRALAALCGTAAVVFAGDDVNDEPVFAAAGPQWLTVRVGNDGSATQARYFVAAPDDVAGLLRAVLAGVPASG